MNNMITNIKYLVYQKMDESHGNWSTDAYKNIILNIILLIYLSEKFNIIYKELVHENDCFEEDKSIYEYFNIFFIPKEARWNNLIRYIEINDCKTIFDNALNYLKHTNPLFKEVILPFSILKIEKYALETFIYLFNRQLTDNKNLEKEFWIELYESFLKDFAMLNETYYNYLKKFNTKYKSLISKDEI